MRVNSREKNKSFSLIRYVCKILQSLVVRNGPGCLEIIDADTLENRRKVIFSAIPQIARFFPSGKVLAVAEHNVIHVTDIATGTKARTLKGHSSTINDIAFFGAGKALK